MFNLYELLEGVLNGIETEITENINEDFFAEKYSMSAGYLRRLFLAAFKQPIGTYIRSRKMAASVENLLHSDLNVIDIAVEYGFEHEQSYIRAFKREFGITPGDLRRSGHVLKITPPLHLFDSSKLDDGLFLGPDIVMIPQFHVIGKKYKIHYRGERDSILRSIEQFIEHKTQIPDTINPNVLINISTEAEENADCFYFMPSVQVKNPGKIPAGFESFTFPSSLCARFSFFGVKHNSDPGKPAMHGITRAIDDPVRDRALMSIQAADGKFRAINDFMDDKNQKYFLERKKINIDKSDLAADEEFYSYWEWFAPVRIKTKDDVPEHPPGIIKTYRQELPPLRFIGKRYWTPNLSHKNNELLSDFYDWCFDSRFDKIEKQSGEDIKTLYEGSGSYACLVKSSGDIFEYWIGMFTPPQTQAPQGYETIDFPQSSLAVLRVYGKRTAIINYDDECRKKLAAEGINPSKDANKTFSFLRFDWRDFFKEDEYGNRILEYCYFTG